MINSLQARILEIYNVVKEIFDANDIAYYAYSGTALGAVRHGGFIPWDDDLDLILPIKDFNRAISLLKIKLPPYMELRMPDKNTSYAHFFIKVIDSRTTFIEEKEIPYSHLYKGVWIDLFPMCNIQDKLIQRKVYIKKINCLLALHRKICMPYCYCYKLPGKMLWWMIRPIKFLFSPDYFFQSWLKMCLTMEKIKTSTVCDSSCNLSQKKQNIFQKNWFNKYETVPFEDTFIRIPNGNDSILRRMYGDYMQLPPEDQRGGHSCDGIIDLDTGYREYQKKKANGLI